MQQLNSLEKELGLSFKDKDLLQLALIHSSYLNENPGMFPEPNERLEFLGDALIGLVVAHELYRRYPKRPEGELTPIRSALVKGDSLAKFARSLHLGDYLLMGIGEEASGGRNRTRNLAGVFESLVGAIFLDKGYEGGRDFVLRIVSEEFEAIGNRSVPKNSKSALQEYVQGQGMSAPSYRIVKTIGKDHAREFTAEVLVNGEVKGRGTGRRKTLAEQEAAQNALETLVGHA